MPSNKYVSGIRHNMGCALCWMKQPTYYSRTKWLITGWVVVSNFFLCSPLFGEDEAILTLTFIFVSKGLVGSTTNYRFFNDFCGFTQGVDVERIPKGVSLTFRDAVFSYSLGFPQGAIASLCTHQR